jgi:hypothetical protein
MTMTFDQAHELATAAFECYTLPENMIIDETSGFSSSHEPLLASFSKPIFFYSKEDEALLNEEGFNTSTAYFNIDIGLETGDIEDVYVIVSAGGNIVGEFTDENRKQAYEGAGLTSFFRAEPLKL